MQHPIGLYGRPDIVRLYLAIRTRQCGYQICIALMPGNTVYSDKSAPLISSVDEKDTIDIFQDEDKSDNISESSEGVLRRVVPPSFSYGEDGDTDCILLWGDRPGSMENLSHRLKVTSILFDVLSGQSEVDHPLCEECTDALLEQLDHQLKITEDECKDYRDFLEKLGNTDENVDADALDEELEQSEEIALKGQLESAETERTRVQEQIQKEKDFTKQLEQQEERYWKEYNEFKRQVQEAENEQRSVDNQLKYAQTQLDKLMKTNVFNTTFHIWHSGHVGTINNFRLGRLPSVPVDWN